MDESPARDEQTDQTPEEIPEETTPTTDEVPESTPEEDDAKTFPAKVVRDLRKENADYRERARTAETALTDLKTQLHTELVRATGMMADPRDIPFDESHLTDAEALETTIHSVLMDKPHLASRKPTGDIGQGIRGNGGNASPDLMSILKEFTG